jgi:hypothetical protein
VSIPADLAIADNRSPAPCFCASDCQLVSPAGILYDRGSLDLGVRSSRRSCLYSTPSTMKYICLTVQEYMNLVIETSPSSSAMRWKQAFQLHLSNYVPAVCPLPFKPIRHSVHIHDLLLFLGRTVCGNRQINRNMPILMHESQERLFHRSKDLAGIPSKLGTKVLGAIEDSGRSDKVDTRVDLGHVGWVWT